MKKFIAAAGLWSLLLLFFIPNCGDRFDKICVKGKSRYKQTLFVKGNNPVIIYVYEDDRIIKKECSEFLKNITFRETYEESMNWLEDYFGFHY